MTPFGRMMMGLVFCGVVSASPAFAQAGQAGSSSASSSGDARRWAVQYDVAGAFGHKSGWASGAEVDRRLSGNWDVFIESGYISDVSNADVADRATVVASALGATASAKRSAVYVDGGLRHQLSPNAAWRPFVLFGGGVARVNTQTTFSQNGKDITGQLGSLGVQLGSDLDGGAVKPVLTAGLGVTKSLGARTFLEASYRYGYIFGGGGVENDEGTTAHRVQVGFGYRF